MSCCRQQVAIHRQSSVGLLELFKFETGLGCQLLISKIFLCSRIHHCYDRKRACLTTECSSKQKCESVEKENLVSLTWTPNGTEMAPSATHWTDVTAAFPVVSDGVAPIALAPPVEWKLRVNFVAIDGP